MNKRSKIIIASILILSLLSIGAYAAISILPASTQDDSEYNILPAAALSTFESVFSNLESEILQRLDASPLAIFDILPYSIVNGRTEIGFSIQSENGFLPINAEGEITIYSNLEYTQLSILADIIENNMQERFELAAHLNNNSLIARLSGSGFLSVISGLSNNYYGIRFDDLDIAIDNLAQEFLNNADIPNFDLPSIYSIFEYIDYNSSYLPNGVERISFYINQNDINQFLYDIAIQFDGTIDFDDIDIDTDVEVAFYISNNRVTRVEIDLDYLNISFDFGDSVYSDWVFEFEIYDEKAYITWAFNQNGAYLINNFLIESYDFEFEFELSYNNLNNNFVISVYDFELRGQFRHSENEFYLSFDNLEILYFVLSISISSEIGASMPELPTPNNISFIEDWDMNNLNPVQDVLSLILEEAVHILN